MYILWSGFYTGFDVRSVCRLLSRTLAFVQFHDYEAAVEAFTNLDGAIFHGRNLVLGLSNSMICQEDILSKRLKKLTVKVKFDNITGELIQVGVIFGLGTKVDCSQYG